jgi:hypothetical protein
MARRNIETKQSLQEKQGKFDQLHIIETLQTYDKFEQGQKWKQMLISLTIKA